MKNDELKWDKRYASNRIPLEPSVAVTSYYELATVGNALDIAAGNCRNSVFLADKGFNVDAVDISAVGLGLQTENIKNVTPIQHDLDTYQILENHYDLILNINFLNRRLFPYIRKGLKPGGVLIFETFMDPRLVGRELEDRKKDQYLDCNELLHSFLDLYIGCYQEREVAFSNGDPIMKATLVAGKKNVAGHPCFAKK